MIKQTVLSFSVVAIAVLFGAGCNQEPITNFDSTAQIDQIGNLPTGMTNGSLETLTDTSVLGE